MDYRLKNASNSLSDVFKGGKIDLSAKNLEKVKDFFGKTKDDVTEQVTKLNKVGSRTSPKGLIGHEFEEYLTKNIGGDVPLVLEKEILMVA